MRHAVTLPAGLPAAAVTVQPRTTAWILVDCIPQVTWSRYVSSPAFLTPSRTLLPAARRAGLLTTRNTVPGVAQWTTGFAPKPGELVVVGRAELGVVAQLTPLVAVLQAHHIPTVILAGAATSIGIEQTALESLQQGLTVVIPEDAVADRAAAWSRLTLYTCRTNEVYPNPTNQPPPMP